MQNAAVAQVFEDIADCLEIAGENVFKIRAYRRAAEAVATLREPIEDLAEAGTLAGIEGLGAATIAKTREFLATGRVQELERLREQYPPGLLELLRVPGLGPKKVAQLFRERGIGSVEALQAAIAGDELKGLAGFGPKTVSNIEAGIRRLGETSSQLPLFAALPLATRLANALALGARDALDASGLSSADDEESRGVVIAGEVRRGCETVSGIDLVARAADAAAVVQAFVQLPQALEVIEQSDERAVIRVRPGLPITLHTARPDAFGAALFVATGSGAHLEAASQRAASRTSSIASGIAWQNGRPTSGASEEEIYAALGVPFIAPEMREDSGEWQAAEQNRLPSLVTASHFRGELHAHSTWSDGTASIRQMVTAARERGYSFHAVTDHSKALVMTNGLDAARLREQAKEIAQVQAEFPDIKILRGVECDILRDGTLDLDDDILHELDIVIASVHSGFKLDEAAQTARMVRAISHPAVDVVAHPTGRIVGGRPGYEVNVGALIEAARDTATALEINASERLDLRDVHARAAREAGVLLCIDTDAHSTRMFGNIGLGILTARRAWCEPADILNTKTADELMAWLNRPQSRA